MIHGQCLQAQVQRKEEAQAGHKGGGAEGERRHIQPARAPGRGLAWVLPQHLGSMITCLLLLLKDAACNSRHACDLSWLAAARQAEVGRASR